MPKKGQSHSLSAQTPPGPSKHGSSTSLTLTVPYAVWGTVPHTLCQDCSPPPLVHKMQSQTMKEKKKRTYGRCPIKCNLWILKFGFHVTFMCHRILFFILVYSKLFKNVNTILGSQTVPTRVAEAGWSFLIPRITNRLRSSSQCLSPVSSSCASLSSH